MTSIRSVFLIRPLSTMQFDHQQTSGANSMTDWWVHTLGHPRLWSTESDCVVTIKIGVYKVDPQAWTSHKWLNIVTMLRPMTSIRSVFLIT